MGREELTRALRQKGEEEARSIWRRAEADVEEYRAGRQKEVDRHCRQRDREAETSASRECLQIEWRVEKKARGLRLKTLQELDRRLLDQAVDTLRRLSPSSRSVSLKALMAEVPDGDWQVVQVHPDDVDAAGGRFPAARIDARPELLGGVAVEARNGGVRIDNSLRQRLATCWPELAGKLLKTLEDESDAGPAGETGD